MISRITLVSRRPELDQGEFKTLLSEGIAEKCLRISTMCGYEQNYAYLKEKGDASHDELVADAFTIERYESLHEYEQALASPEFAQAMDELLAISARAASFTCLENVSIPCAAAEGSKKKISLLQRSAPGVTFEDYTREWLVVHSYCMLKMPKDVFYGYNQHLIIDRAENGAHADYEKLPFDGILELYFSDADAVAHSFKTSPEGRQTVAHRKEFMCGVDPFQVDWKVFR